MTITTQQVIDLADEIGALERQMNEMMAQVANFNEEVIGIKPDDSGTVKPLTPERFVFRIKAAIEELSEAIAAYQRGDHGEVVDAFHDCSFFNLGAIVEMNVPAGQTFTDITNANLAKKKAKLAKRPESGGMDAEKPEGWEPPNHDWAFHLSPIAIECAKLHANKNQDYGHWSGYFPFGHSSFQQMLFMKMQRMMNLNPDFYKGEVNFEGLRDTVLDMVNYCCFYAEWMGDPSKFPLVGGGK